jgi:hypothetical protein
MSASPCLSVSATAKRSAVMAGPKPELGFGSGWAALRSYAAPCEGVEKGNFSCGKREKPTRNEAKHCNARPPANARSEAGERLECVGPVGGLHHGRAGAGEGRRASSS